jgi:hypothetical protein
VAALSNLTKIDTSSCLDYAVLVSSVVVLWVVINRTAC